jgi:hypothetical protein
MMIRSKIYFCIRKEEPRWEGLKTIQRRRTRQGKKAWLLDAVIFNYLVRNNDARGKNFSLLSLIQDC